MSIPDPVHALIRIHIRCVTIAEFLEVNLHAAVCPTASVFKAEAKEWRQKMISWQPLPPGVPDSVEPDA